MTLRAHVARSVNFADDSHPRHGHSAHNTARLMVQHTLRKPDLPNMWYYGQQRNSPHGPVQPYERERATRSSGTAEGTAEGQFHAHAGTAGQESGQAGLDKVRLHAASWHAL